MWISRKRTFRQNSLFIKKYAMWKRIYGQVTKLLNTQLFDLYITAAIAIVRNVHRVPKESTWHFWMCLEAFLCVSLVLAKNNWTTHVFGIFLHITVMWLREPNEYYPYYSQNQYIHPLDTEKTLKCT